VKRYSDGEKIPTLVEALSEHMSAAELKKLASLTGSRLPTRKAELADLIILHLQGDRLRTVFECLDELQKAAVAEVVHSGDALFAAGRFRAKYGRDPSWGSLDEYARGARPTALRFFFFGRGVMPTDLKERLRVFVPPPVEAEVKTLESLSSAYSRPFKHWNPKTKREERGTESIPLKISASERAAQRELLSVLRLVDAGKVAVSDATRKATSATIGAISSVLEGDDYYPHVPAKDKWHDENAGPIRAFAWPLLIQAGGLAQLSGTRLQLTKAGRKALGDPAAETLQRLWEKWLDTTILDELSRIDCVKGQTGKGRRGLTAVGSRRDAIADGLAECPAGAWIATDEFLRFMRASGSDFSVTRNAWNLYIGELQYGSLGYEGGEHIVEERYVLCLLLEYAATAGLIDVALIPPAGARPDYGSLWGTDDLPYFSRYDGLMYFRINPLGAFCLGSAPAYVPAPTERKPVLRVLPNLEIAAVGAELEPADRLALDAYAVRVSDRVWRIEPARLLAVTEEGRSVDEIRAFLAARTADPLPDTVDRLLGDTSERGARVRDLGLARLVECDDPALAALVANDTRTRKHCMRAGERHLVVPARSEAAFRRALRDVGYLLATEDRRMPAARGLRATGAAPAPEA
jgi:hypothetical protein